MSTPITNASIQSSIPQTPGREGNRSTGSAASLQISGWHQLPQDQVGFSQETALPNEGISQAKLNALQDSFGLGDSFENDSQEAEPHEEEATVAVFDDFRNADKKGQMTHGELVEGHLQAQAGLNDEDIQRYQTDLGADFKPFEEALAGGEKDALERFIETSYTNSLDSTTDALEEVLSDDDSKIRTVNQSQSQARGRLARDIWQRADSNEPFRKDLAESLGLDPTVKDKELGQALTSKINETVAGSEKIADSKQRYDEISEKAAQAGLTHVVTSGNLGDFAKQWEKLGVKVDDDFYDSALINENTIVAAALDGSAPPRSAGFNSPKAGADLAAPGVDIDVTAQDGDWTTASGTSLAAPAVSAVAARLAAKNPDLTPSEIEAILTRTADPAQGPTSDIGQGVFDPDEALTTRNLTTS